MLPKPADDNFRYTDRPSNFLFPVIRISAQFYIFTVSKIPGAIFSRLLSPKGNGRNCSKEKAGQRGTTHIISVRKMEKRKIILITGGQRSGKSRYAQERALQMSDRPVYLATSRVWDEEYRERIRRHQADRGPQWTNIEEEKRLSDHSLEGRVVVVDCVTLWCTNFFFDNEGDAEKSLCELKQEFDRFTAQEAVFLFVTNEIGWGGVSENRLQRRFTDLQGWMNQYIAGKADEILLMVSGISMKIK